MQARGFLNNRLKYCWPKVINSGVRSVSNARVRTDLTQFSFDVIYLITPFLLNCK